MRSWLFLFSCNLMWALQFTCVKLVQDQVGALFTVWGPMTLATVMLYPIVRLERRGDSERTKRGRGDVLTFFLLALLGVFPGQIFVTWGTRMSLASNAALLMLTLPVSTAILAYVFLGERMTRVRWVSFAAAIMGVALCSGKDLQGLKFSAEYLAGNGLVFLGTLGSAFYNSYGKKMLERYSPMEMLFFSYIAMFVILTPFVLLKEGSVLARIPEFSARTWVGLALLTFFHNFLSMVLFLKALKELDAIQTALSNYLITFFGVPIAVIWLGERPTLRGVLGGVVILGSTLLITLWEEKRSSARASTG